MINLLFQQFEVFSPSNSAPISISSKKNAFLNTLVQSYKYSTARNGQTPGKPCNCYKFLYDMCAFYAYFVNICFSKFCRLYYAKIGIGTPARDYYVQVDTGSDIMWVNCIQCNECPKKSSLGVGFSSCSMLVTCLIFLCCIPCINKIFLQIF